MKRIVLAFSFVFALTLSVTAQKSPVFVKDKIAIAGYDAVAYFTVGKPIVGSKEFLFNYKNADWYFSSRQNLDSFKTNPEKYAPQYGGYCAYGMADGHKAPTEPDAWTIQNGKLYFNYNKDVQRMWIKKKADFIETADKNWPGIKDKE